MYTHGGSACYLVVLLNHQTKTVAGSSFLLTLVLPSLTLPVQTLHRLQHLPPSNQPPHESQRGPFSGCAEPIACQYDDAGLFVISD